MGQGTDDLLSDFRLPRCSDPQESVQVSDHFVKEAETYPVWGDEGTVSTLGCVTRALVTCSLLYGSWVEGKKLLGGLAGPLAIISSTRSTPWAASIAMGSARRKCLSQHLHSYKCFLYPPTQSRQDACLPYQSCTGYSKLKFFILGLIKKKDCKQYWENWFLMDFYVWKSN